MADKSSYPQIPSTVWWGVRLILQKTPGAKIDEEYLSIHLGVQEAAARQYVAELRKTGILNDESKITDIARKWRMDETYLESIDDILKVTYPESLLQIAPPDQADRQKAVAWFMRQGLGEGSAKNKAATYILISSQNPNESPAKKTSTKINNAEKISSGSEKKKSNLAESESKSRSKSRSAVINSKTKNKKIEKNNLEVIPLNVNIQIHISADATNDQIESIFSAMKRYLYDR